MATVKEAVAKVRAQAELRSVYEYLALHLEDYMPSDTGEGDEAIPWTCAELDTSGNVSEDTIDQIQEALNKVSAEATKAIKKLLGEKND